MDGSICFSLLWARGGLLRSLKRSEGAACSEVPRLYLEVEDGDEIVLRMPVCLSHVSDGDMGQQNLPGFYFVFITRTTQVCSEM